MAEFIQLDPPPTLCGIYGTGNCCHDYHFDVSSVFPAKEGALCGEDIIKGTQTADRKRVNCKECVELLHS